MWNFPLWLDTSTYALVLQIQLLRISPWMSTNKHPHSLKTGFSFYLFQMLNGSADLKTLTPFFTPNFLSFINLLRPVYVSYLSPLSSPATKSFSTSLLDYFTRIYLLFLSLFIFDTATRLFLRYIPWCFSFIPFLQNTGSMVVLNVSRFFDTPLPKGGI